MEPSCVDVGDDRVLAVIGDACFDAEGAANRGLRAVGRDHQAGLEGFADIRPEPDRILARLQRVDTRMTDPKLRKSCHAFAQGLPEQPVLDRIAERGHTLFRRGQCRRTEDTAFGYVDAPDRRCLACDRGPGADAFEYAPAAARERRRARIEARLLVGRSQHRLDDDDVEG